MLYSIGNWIYNLGTEPLAVTFQRLKRFGFDGVELIFEPGQYDVTEIRYLCAQHGLRALSILGWSIASMNSRDLAHPDQRTRQEAIAYIKQAVDFAAHVGASLVVVMAAPAGRSAPIGAVRTYMQSGRPRLRRSGATRSSRPKRLLPMRNQNRFLSRLNRSIALRVS